MDYTDLETVEATLVFTNPSEETRALLAQLISDASAMVDNYCGRIFGIPTDQAVTAETFTDDNGRLIDDFGRTLWLDKDLCSTPTFAEAPAPTCTYLPSDTPYNRIVREDGIWPDPTVITGHWAYSMTPPAVISRETVRLVQWLYHQTEAVMSQGQTVNGPNNMPTDIRNALDYYRRLRLP